MKFFNFFFIIFFYFINSEREVQLWDKNPKINFLDIPDLININSYIFDPNSTTELYLINNYEKLYFKNETKNFILNNNLGIKDLKPSLIKVYSDCYYFCSSSYNELITINFDKLNLDSIPNPINITNINAPYTLKCFLVFHISEANNVIMIAYIGTEYLFFFYPQYPITKEEEKNYGYFIDNVYKFEDENHNPRIIRGINNALLEKKNDEPAIYFIALAYDIKEKNNYFYFIQKPRDNIKPNYIKPLENKDLELYDVIELATRKMSEGESRSDQIDRLAYIFSYKPGQRDYVFYVVNIENQGKHEINGKYYFSFFNDVKINYAKFIQNTALLYYDIENLYDRKNYIGVADLEFFLLIYNIEEKPDSQLYFHFWNNKSEELFYFNHSNKISHCPFIEEKNDCFYSRKYFDIDKTDNKYNNKNSSNCENKNKMGPYCVGNCPIGFEDNGKECLFCNEYIFLNKYVSFNNKKCLEENECNDVRDENHICYNCFEDQKYYKEDCLESCEDVFGINITKEEGNCIACKDNISEENKTYYSFLNKNCISRDECLEGAEEKDINDDLYFCKECRYINSSLALFKYGDSKGMCTDKCPDKFVNITGTCQLCKDYNNNTPYYQEGKCKSKCDKEGYAIYKILNEFNINIEYCEYCRSIGDKGWFIEEGNCVPVCSYGYFINDTENKLCDFCDNNTFYVQNNEMCMDKCPKGTRKTNNKTCIFCTKDEYYIEENNEGKCLKYCNQEIRENISISVGSTNYSYNECVYCNESQIVANDKCIDCSGYLYNNSICYQCFCGHENFTCYNGSSQCDCFNSSHYYGYSCQFYSEEDINEKEMIIVSMNGNRLIKTGPNFFTYSFKDNTELSKDCSFNWKFYIDNKEVTEDKTFKEMFITSNNEAVFGINKNVFENNNYKDFSLSLEIYLNRNKRYSHKISLIIIESFEYESRIDKGENSALELKELNRNIELVNKKDIEKVYKGKYYFQYGLVDNNNERIPLTNYIDSEKIDINTICSQGYFINIKNDREEVKRIEQIMSNCKFLSLKLNEILNLNSEVSYKAEQILLLISNLRKNNYDEIDDNSLSELFKFVDDSISTMINSEGYWEDIKKDNYMKNITYSEPKLIFSLIYHLSKLIKKDLIPKNNITHFFDFYENIFEKVFKETPISNKTLSDSDIKSLFRTIDNLYDICIEKDLNVGNRFVQTLDNLSKYLAYISYPSMTTEFRGKRISFFTYNLGLHENSISFPYIYTNFDTKLDDLSTYIYNNWYLNEQQSCDQMKETLFCLNIENHLDLKKKIFNNNNISNAFISLYLLPEINSANEKNDPNIDESLIGDDEDIDKITVNKNFSMIFKLFKNENENIVEINDKAIKAEFEFPFNLNADKEEKKQKKKSGLDKYGLNVTESPDNSDLFCHTKNMYNIAGSKYPCFTHFDYAKKKVRCSCNIISGDELFVKRDASFAQDVIDYQFQKEHFSMKYKYILFIVYIFLFLLLIPEIFYLLHDIKKESKIIKENKINIEDERKNSYIEARKYCGKGIFLFSFYLTLNKFPYFSAFNKYYKTYPKFLRHLVISIGLLIGFIMPLVPYLFISFSERDTFIGQRDINFMDSEIETIPSDKYKILSSIFSILGLIFGNLFIYICSKILDYEKDEIDIWLKIKTICKDYIYYDIKSEVLLGAIWNKIKLRMFSYYYICGKYILKNNKKIKKSNKFEEYIVHSSRNYETKKTHSNNFNDLDEILPSISRDSNNLNISRAINSSRTEKSFELGKIENEDRYEESDILLDKNLNENLQMKRYEIQKKYMKKVNPKIRANLNLKICKPDNFKLDKRNKYDKSKRQIERFEKVRNKYIYVHKKHDINAIEIDDSLFEDKNHLIISQQNNYFYIPNKSFINLNKGNTSSNASINIIKKFIIISAILMLIFTLLIIITLYLVKEVLNKFDEFILKAWIVPLIIVITILNFVLYYLKMLIASFLIFHYYYLRKKNCFVKFLFWLFVDKAMIQRYKVKNLITKYKKEFDYLQN